MAWSRLKAAWAALGIGVVGMMTAAVLAPSPADRTPSVEITLPAEPDRYAAGGLDGGEPVPIDEPVTDETPLPRIVFGQPSDAADDSDGEVVITVADAPQEARSVRAPIVPPSAPVDALTAQTESGVRPAIGPDGKTPFAAYRRLQSASDAAGVAVIVSGLGLDEELTRRAVALPPEVSLAYAPYAKDLPGQIESARRAGHEVLIELPMGTPGVAPAALGPAGLLQERTPAANATRLEWLLSRAPAYPMVTNYLGRGFASDGDAMARVMTEVGRAGLAYVDDTGLAAQAARVAGVPFAETNVLIEPDAGDVPSQLAALANRTAAGEVALGKVYATTDSLAAISQWTGNLPEGVQLVPASSVVSSR